MNDSSPESILELESEHHSSEPRVWSPGFTLLWGIVMFIVVMMAQTVISLVFMGIEMAKNPPPEGNASPQYMQELTEKLMSNATMVGVCAIAACLLMIPAAIGVIKLCKNSNLQDYLCLYNASWKAWVFWLLVVVLCFFGSTYIVEMRPYFTDKPSDADKFMEMMKNTEGFNLLQFLGVVVAAPIYEELLFRGFLFKGFARSFLKNWGTILVTAFLFTVMHWGQYDWYDLLPLFILSIFMGVARYKTNSLWVPIGMHALNNLGAIIFINL